MADVPRANYVFLKDMDKNRQIPNHNTNQATKRE